MQNNKEPQYPMSLFVIGFFMNFTKNFFLLLPRIILLAVGVWVKWCWNVGFLLLLADVIISLIEQMKIGNTVLNNGKKQFCHLIGRKM